MVKRSSKTDSQAHSSLHSSPSARKPGARPARVLGLPGKLPNVIRLGYSHAHWRDLYHLLLTLSWFWFLALLGLLYIGTNALFAFAYLLDPGGVAGIRPGSFADAFSFSVQTLATIGYGVMHPQSLYAHILVAIEALVGLLGVALATGLMFARFSRPTARVMFSQVAVVTPYNGVPTLMFRAANQRHNQILEAQVRLTLVRDEVTQEGQYMRRFYDLELVRSRTPVFFLTWTIMHAMDESSPLRTYTLQDLEDSGSEIVVTLTGLDETFSQTIHTRHSYLPEDIHWNSRLSDILTVLPDGRRAVDYSRFHRAEPLEE